MVNRGEVAFTIAAAKSGAYKARGPRQQLAASSPNTPNSSSAASAASSSLFCCTSFVSVRLLIVFLAVVIFLSAGRMFLEQIAAATRSKKRGASIVALAGGGASLLDPLAPGGIVLPAGIQAAVGGGGGEDTATNREEAMQILSLSKPYMSRSFHRALNETFVAVLTSSLLASSASPPGGDGGGWNWGRLREAIFTQRAQHILKNMRSGASGNNKNNKDQKNRRQQQEEEEEEGREKETVTLMLPIRREFVSLRHVHRWSSLCTVTSNVTVHALFSLQNRSTFFDEDLLHLLPPPVFASVVAHRQRVALDRAALATLLSSTVSSSSKRKKERHLGIQRAKVRHADGATFRYMTDVLTLVSSDYLNNNGAAAQHVVSVEKAQWVEMFAPCLSSVSFMLIEPLDALPTAAPHLHQGDTEDTTANANNVKKKKKKNKNKSDAAEDAAADENNNNDDDDAKPPIPYADLVMVAMQCEPEPFRDSTFVAVMSEAHIPFKVPGDGEDFQKHKNQEVEDARTSFMDLLIRPMRYGSGNISVTQCTIAQKDKGRQLINVTLQRLRHMKHRGFGEKTLASYELNKLQQQQQDRAREQQQRQQHKRSSNRTEKKGGDNNNDDDNDQDVHNFVLVDRGLEVGMGNDKQFMIPHVVRRYHGYPLVDGRRHHEEPVEMVSPYCFAADRFRFALTGGLVSDSSSIFVDDVISGRLSRHLRASAIALVRIRITKVEKVMEGISLVDVHKAGNSLRQQVRLAYSEVVESTTLWEDVSGMSFDRAENAMTRSEMYQAIKKKEEVEWTALEASMTKVEERLAAHAARLHDAARELVKLGKNRDSSATEEEIGWDFSLRLQRMYRYWFLAVSTATCLYDMFAIPPQLLEYFDANKIQLNHPSYVADGGFYERWAAALSAVHRSKGGVHSALQHVVSLREQAATEPNTRIFWHSFCCGCCGFSSEIVHFVHPLSSRRSIHLFNSNKCFCQGYPAAVVDALKRMHISQEHYVVQHQNPGDNIIWISHTDPLSYHITLLEKRKPDYFIGRSMYEFSRISKAWVESIEKFADEVWVPAKFVKSVFARSGVNPEKLVVIPEPLDVYYFDPQAHDPLPLPLSASRPHWWQWCNKEVPDAAGRYKFLSNFKWEPRKGWDVLFEAYDMAFGNNSSSDGGGGGNGTVVSEEKVTLYILSYFFFNGPSPDGANIHNVSLMLTQLQSWLRVRQPQRKTLADLPHFCIVTEMVPEEDLVRLYRTMDAFVLPTRGEGWGLPTIQAMSMAMPTISTNWGGNTEFMTKETSFLIPIDGLDELPKDNLYGSELGKKWALPSASETARLMKYVKSNPSHAAAVGQRGRRHIVKHFSEASLVDLVDQRLEEIRQIIKRR